MRSIAWVREGGHQSDVNRTQTRYGPTTAQVGVGQNLTPGTRDGTGDKGRDGTGRDRTGRDGTGRDGMGQNRRGQDGTPQGHNQTTTDGIGQDGTGRNWTGRDGTGRDGTGRDSTVRYGSRRGRTGRSRTGRDGGLWAARAVRVSLHKQDGRDSAKREARTSDGPQLVFLPSTEGLRHR